MLQVIKAKPNPAGKDRRGRLLISQTQLGGEWVDIKNISTLNYPLKFIKIYHLAYTNGISKPALLKDFSRTIFNLVLPPGGVMRIHSGNGPESLLLPIDKQGANIHYFTRKNYVWNNDKTDKPIIYDSKNKKTIDYAYYDPFPGDGKILTRVGNKLI